MNLVSILIPARNEALNLKDTVAAIIAEFEKEKIPFEIIIVDDGSADHTMEVALEIHREDDRVRMVANTIPYGMGNAIKKGLEHYRGDCVIITMADSSDSPGDMVRYARAVEEGNDCCFGDRWCRGTHVHGYPFVKYVLNRLANWWIGVLFHIRYRDVTNAFKCYSRRAIEGIQPILSHHFNITVELPLKAIVRGYSYSVIPTDWHERKKGKTNLRLQEMSGRYIFIILYVWLEKLLCKKDYQKR